MNFTKELMALCRPPGYSLVRVLLQFQCPGGRVSRSGKITLTVVLRGLPHQVFPRVGGRYLALGPDPYAEGQENRDKGPGCFSAVHRVIQVYSASHLMRAAVPKEVLYVLSGQVETLCPP